MKTNTFLNKSSWGAFKQIQRDKLDFINNSPYLRSLSIQNKQGFRSVFKSASQVEDTWLQAILSPMYNNDGWLSSDSNYFESDKNGLSGRIQKKVEISTQIIGFLQEYFELQVNFIIADAWMLISPNRYNNIWEIDEQVSESVEIFQKQIEIYLWNDDFSISKMSDSQLPIERIRDMNFSPKREDCVKLIWENSIAPKALLRWLDEIINMYWITAAYYEIDAYFKESKYLWDNYKNNIILNVEGSSLGNKKLIKWKDNLSMDRENWNGW
jgi:hypothetical protein